MEAVKKVQTDAQLIESPLLNLKKRMETETLNIPISEFNDTSIHINELASNGSISEMFDKKYEGFTEEKDSKLLARKSKIVVRQFHSKNYKRNFGATNSQLHFLNKFE